MDQMVGTPGDVVAIFDTRFGGQKFESAVDMEAAQQLCHELRGEAGLEGPMNQVSQRRSRDSEM